MCSDDATKFREDLMNIARTTLSSKILTQYKDHFSNLAVTAVLRLKVSYTAVTYLVTASQWPVLCALLCVFLLLYSGRCVVF